MAHSAYEPRSLNDDCKKAGEPKNERLQRQKNQAGESKPSSLQIPNLSICSAAASYTANTSEVTGAVTTTTCQEDQRRHHRQPFLRGRYTNGVGRRHRQPSCRHQQRYHRPAAA